MRLLILLASTTMLAACGGAGPQSAGSSAPPTGSGGGDTGGGTSHTFVNPTEAKTYTAVGSSHSYQSTVEDPGSIGQQRSLRTTTQINQLYQGDATTVRNSNLKIAYDPRDAIFNCQFFQRPGGHDRRKPFPGPGSTGRISAARLNRNWVRQIWQPVFGNIVGVHICNLGPRTM